MNVGPNQVNPHQPRKHHPYEHRNDREEVVLLANHFVVEAEDVLADETSWRRVVVLYFHGHVCHRELPSLRQRVLAAAVARKHYCKLACSTIHF
jgi:hypothetical protein